MVNIKYLLIIKCLIILKFDILADQLHEKVTIFIEIIGSQGNSSTAGTESTHYPSKLAALQGHFDFSGPVTNTGLHVRIITSH